MSLHRPSAQAATLQSNLEHLAENPYPGRGIVLGVSPDEDAAVQAYWVMGRSDNSRNRVLVQDGDMVKTEAFDESKVEDPSLIIYNAMSAYGNRKHRRVHVVSNGDQTDTVTNYLANHRDIDPDSDHGATRAAYQAFQQALRTREFEPDTPNNTPRITGMIALDGAHSSVSWSIISKNPTDGKPNFAFGTEYLTEVPTGTGICYHTYLGDGNPLPSFRENPYGIALQDSAAETAETLWGILNTDNRVGIVVKYIDLETGDADHHIINQLAN